MSRVIVYRNGYWFCNSCYCHDPNEDVVKNHSCGHYSFTPSVAAASSAGGGPHTHNINLNVPGYAHDYTHDFGETDGPISRNEYTKDRQVLDQTLALLLSSMADLKKDMGALIERMDELEEGLINE